ncbi:MAG: amidohydrolase family protein, partial [Odoribacter sp.]|nr:amidohydrolase family protein [Odoribacter sp.]
YKMLPEEVIHATTINTAYAMGVQEEVGSIAVGKLANFYITTPISGIEYLPYAYTANLIETVFLRGEQY